MAERALTSTFDPGTGTLAFSGAVDELSLTAFGTDVAEARADATGPLLIDLSDVDYFPSAAVSALISTLRTDDAAAPTELLAVQGSIAQRVLHICGLPHRTS
jgi:anti-anti-sigma factor